MAQEAGRKIVIGLGEGATLPLLQIVHKVTSDSLGGGLSIIEGSIPPAEMIPPHTPTHEDERSYVLAGELTCEIGGEIVVAPADSYVIKARGVSHALANTGTVPVQGLEIHSPGALETYYDDYEAIVARGLPDAERQQARAELGRRYGVTWHDERIPEVSARLGLEL